MTDRAADLIVDEDDPELDEAIGRAPILPLVVSFS